MQRKIVGFAAGLALLATGLLPASADPSLAPGTVWQQIPYGSYQQSCANIQVQGDQLIADCNLASGGTQNSSLSISSCARGDIANTNGRLTCNRTRYSRANGYGYGAYETAPSGSYQQSCTNVRMGGTMLTGTCTDPNGNNITTTLDISNCNGSDVANMNGRLQCSGIGYYNRDSGYGYGQYGSAPPGSYQASCTNVNMRGSMLTATCTPASGNPFTSTLDFLSCYCSDIANRNGGLQCSGPVYYNGNGNGYGRTPNGSYQSSCTNVVMRGSQLTGTCSAPNGANITSTLDISQCGGADIANRNGYLRCG